MPKRKRPRWTDVPNVPEDLPPEALPLWPSLERWPTAAEARHFVKATRRDPESRLAVLTGLRRFSSVDLSVPWAWLAINIPIVLALFTLPAQEPWLTIIIVSVAAAAIITFLSKMTTLSANTDERRRRALSWLRAYEDELSARRRIR